MSEPEARPLEPLQTPAFVLTREQAVDEVRRSIMRHELVPGQRLIEAELCDWLNTSRGTVRLALMDLEHEGLVERIANRGARVRVVSLQEALDLVEVRLVVETLCVGRAAQRIDRHGIARLRKLANLLDQSARQGDVETYAETTQAVFETYVAIADQPVAADMLLRLRARNTRHRYRLTFLKDRPLVSLPYWQALIEAICARDPEAAGRALQRQADNIAAAMRATAVPSHPWASMSD